MSASLYAVVDPSTGDLVKEYPTATDEQIEQAIAAATQGTPRLVARIDGRRPRRTDPQGRRAARAAQGRTRQDHQPRDGQADRPVRGRGRLQRGDLRVLRRQRREVPRRRADRPRRGRRFGADPAQLGRRAARHHAVELPVLPGRPVRGTEPDAGQHHPAQARAPVPRVGRGNPADLRRRRVSRGRLREHLRDERSGRRHHRRPSRARGFADGLRARGRSCRGDRGPQPEEGRPRTRWLRSVHRAELRRP